MSTPETEVMTGAQIIADIDAAIGDASHSIHDSTEWWEPLFNDGTSNYDTYIRPTVERIASAYDALATRCAAADEEVSAICELLAPTMPHALSCRPRDQVQRLTADLTAARAQVAAMEADAKRLEWLQRNALELTCLDPESDASYWTITYMNPANIETAGLVAGGSTLREAIDAALPTPTPQPE